MCMALPSFAECLDMATLGHTGPSDTVARTARNRFSYLPTSLQTSRGPESWMSVPCFFPLHPCREQASSWRLCLVTHGQGSPSGFSFMRFNVPVSPFCTRAQRCRCSQSIFQIFEICSEGRSVGLDAGASPVLVRVMFSLGKKAQEGP